MDIKDSLFDLYLYHDLDITTRNKLLYKEYSNKKLTNQDKLTRKLLQLIQQSSLSDEIEIKQKASAAITALNYSNFDFSDLQFPNIKIPYADLSASTIHANNFQNVNFDSVKLNGSRVSYQINENDPFKGHTHKVQYFSPTAPVSAIHISPDDTFMITGGMEGRVIMWDFNSLKMIKEIAKFSGETLKSSSLSNDGKMLALSSVTLVMLINLESNYTGYFKGHSNYVHALAFSPDSKILVSGSKDLLIKVWTIDSFNEKNCKKQNDVISSSKDIKKHVGEIKFLQFIDNGAKMVSFGSDQNLNLWETKEWTNLLSVQIPFQSCTLKCISKNEEEFVFAKYQMDLKMLNINNLKIMAQKQAEQMQLEKIQKEQQQAEIAQNEECELESQIQPRRGMIMPVESWDKGETLIKEITQTYRANYGHIESAAICPYQTKVLGGSFNGKIYVWDFKSRKLIHFKKQAHLKAVIAVQFTNSGVFFISSGFENCIKVWDSNTYTLINCIQGSHNSITSISLSPNCSNIVGGTADGVIKVWDAQSGIFKSQLDSSNMLPIVDIIHSEQNVREIYSCGADANIYHWDIMKQDCLGENKAHRNVITCICQNPDGSHLYTGCYDSSIAIWDQNFQLIKTLNKHTTGIITLDTSNSGNILISCDESGFVNLWNKNKNYFCIKSIKTYPIIVKSAKISPDGTKIAAIEEHEFIYITSLTNGKHLKFNNAEGVRQVQLTWHPNSSLFIVSEKYRIKFYNIACKKLAQYNLYYPIVCMKFNPIGDKLYFSALGSVDLTKYGFMGQIKIFDYNSFCKANMKQKIQLSEFQCEKKEGESRKIVKAKRTRKQN